MYRYPLNLDASKQNYVMFYSYGKNNVSEIISLYMPPAVSMADGASYSNFDLGPLGSTGAEIGKTLFEGDGNAKTALENAIGTNGSRTGVQKAALQQAFSNFGLSHGAIDRVRDLYMKQQGKVVNPNTVLQYNNSNIRGYQFTFKMVAESESEAKEIKRIIHAFRSAMYGEKDSALSLSYPATWAIMFQTPAGPNKYLPAIHYECYLENLTANYNTNDTMMHADGAPLEVDVQLQFRETKALSRSEINALHDYTGGDL